MKDEQGFLGFHCPRWRELPDMDLYMDQVVTLLNSSLQLFTQPHQGKPITSTMINNYVKHGIVNAPIKKRYMNRCPHCGRLYSMEEISNLISVQVEKYPQDQAYDYFCAELECCLTCIFSHKKVRHIPSDDEGSAIVDLIRNTIQSIAYTAYVRETLQERLLKVNEHPVDDK